MAVTLDEVSQFVSRESQRRNGKIVPVLPGMMKKMCTDPHFYVFNVGPWKWERQLGGRGSKTVQPCDENKSYSDPLTLPLLDNETVASDMNKMENRQEDGMMVVDAFLMRGYGFRPEMSLENWGVSVIDHWPPNAEDLKGPKKLLNKKLDELIADADKSHEQRKYDDITEYHRMAVRLRGLQKPWMNENPDLVSCPACGMQIMPNIAKCPHCRATLNLELAKKFFPEEYRKQ